MLIPRQVLYLACFPGFLILDNVMQVLCFISPLLISLVFNLFVGDTHLRPCIHAEAPQSRPPDAQLEAAFALYVSCLCEFVILELELCASAKHATCKAPSTLSSSSSALGSRYSRGQRLRSRGIQLPSA